MVKKNNRETSYPECEQIIEQRCSHNFLKNPIPSIMENIKRKKSTSKEHAPRKRKSIKRKYSKNKVKHSSRKTSSKRKSI